MKNIFLNIVKDGTPILFCSGCQKTRYLIFGTDKNIRADTLLQMLHDFAYIHRGCHERHQAGTPVTHEIPAIKMSQAEIINPRVGFPGLKAAVCIYHRNIFNIYKPEWVEKCLASIRAQTFQDFKVYEVNYGSDEKMLWTGQPPQYRQWKKEFPDHCHAMNFIFDQAFRECNVIFNVNLDDWYHPQRFELQLQAISRGYDLVSSDFCIIDHDGKKMADRIMSRLNIEQEFKRGHNLIAHPVIAMTGNFWLRNRYYRPEDYEKRAEDFEMWKRAAAKKEKIVIVPEILLFHRLHSKQTGRINK